METGIVEIWIGQRGSEAAIVRLLDAAIVEEQLPRESVKVAVPARVEGWHRKREGRTEVRARNRGA